MPFGGGHISKLEKKHLVVNVDHEGPLREVVGELGRNLKIIAKCCGVDVEQRGNSLMVAGDMPSVQDAADIIEQLVAVANTGHEFRSSDVEQACRMLLSEPNVNLVELYQNSVAVGAGRKTVHPRSIRQRAYLHAMQSSPLVFGVGPAGTGKTYLAMAMAVGALSRGEVRRIILCRPAVEAGEKLGFLPGDLAEKVNPYLRPLYDALHDLVGFERASKLVQNGVIEVAPLAFMRGRTLSGAAVILDEAQNTTPEQMKMFLTRIGLESRVVVTGDVTQIDLPRGQWSGLVHAIEVLEDVPEATMVHFSDLDVVRHPLVSSIIRAYQRAEVNR